MYTQTKQGLEGKRDQRIKILPALPPRLLKSEIQQLERPQPSAQVRYPPLSMPSCQKTEKKKKVAMPCRIISSARLPFPLS